ncbi:hypothetical protein HGRIS_006936 [Hohenbuehelia grisea]|uniref:Serine aminopeptidase S33 domain-containing protein n=1 Tax=Hohenbuehelia grisea TaxID=104357 RepID=A0ABR3JAI8_9AGAR
MIVAFFWLTEITSEDEDYYCILILYGTHYPAACSDPRWPPVPTPTPGSRVAGHRNTNFYTRTYTPPGTPVAILVFCHGAAEHCERYTSMHDSLSSLYDIALFSYDQRGFGRTALDAANRTSDSAYGRTTWADQLDDLDWALRTARNAFPSVPSVPIFLMGTSMGGGIVLGYLARAIRPPDATTLVSGVIAGIPCLKLTNEPPKAIIWLARQIARLSPYLLYPIRNKTEGPRRELHNEPEGVREKSLQAITDFVRPPNTT